MGILSIYHAEDETFLAYVENETELYQMEPSQTNWADAGKLQFQDLPASLDSNLPSTNTVYIAGSLRNIITVVQCFLLFSKPEVPKIRSTES